MKFLIVGLGNIGEEYEETRHNVGFKVADHIAAKAGIGFSKENHAYVARYRFQGKTLVVLKPTTFMNRSGMAVRFWMQRENIPAGQILVVLDDLNFDFGTIKLKPRGSDGGHNGLKDIQTLLQTMDYPRLRVGIGRPEHKGTQVDYVLGKWGPEENKHLEEIIDKCAEAVKKFVSLGIQRAMSEVN